MRKAPLNFVYHCPQIKSNFYENFFIRTRHPSPYFETIKVCFNKAVQQLRFKISQKAALVTPFYGTINTGSDD